MGNKWVRRGAIALVVLVCAAGLVARGLASVTPNAARAAIALACPGAVYAFAGDRAAAAPNWVALTIDDGPALEGDSTQRILEVLEQHDASATFFVISEQIERRERASRERFDPLTAAIARRHELGNHLTRDEASILLGEHFPRELARARDRLAPYLPSGQAVHWVRPGVGWCTPAMQTAIAAGSDYPAVLGSVWPYDTLPFVSARYATDFILRHLHPGAIVVLHDGGARGARTVAVLAELLPALEAANYRAVTLSELAARSRPLHAPASQLGWRETLRHGVIVAVERSRQLAAQLARPDRVVPRSLARAGGLVGVWIVSAGLLLGAGAIANPPLWALGETGRPRFLAEAIQLLFVPALFEELLFRGLLLPSPVELTRGSATLWPSLPVAIALFVGWHLLAAPVLQRWEPGSRYTRVFSQPVFLGAAALLGIACALSYAIVESIWAAIALHWLVVVVWLLLLGGETRLRPNRCLDLE